MLHKDKAYFNKYVPAKVNYIYLLHFLVDISFKTVL